MSASLQSHKTADGAERFINYVVELYRYADMAVHVVAVLVHYIDEQELWGVAGFKSLDDCLEKSFGFTSRDSIFQERKRRGSTIWSFRDADAWRWVQLADQNSLSAISSLEARDVYKAAENARKHKRLATRPGAFAEARDRENEKAREAEARDPTQSLAAPSIAMPPAPMRSVPMPPVPVVVPVPSAVQLVQVQAPMTAQQLALALANALATHPPGTVEDRIELNQAMLKVREAMGKLPHIATLPSRQPDDDVVAIR